MGEGFCIYRFGKATSIPNLASNARKNFIHEEARRGDIVDRKGSLLATTRSVVVLGVDPHSFKEKDSNKLKQLATLLDLDSEKVEESVRRKFIHSGNGGNGNETYQMGEIER